LYEDLPNQLSIRIYGKRVYTERVYDARHVGKVGYKRMQRADSDDHLQKIYPCHAVIDQVRDLSMVQRCSSVLLVSHQKAFKRFVYV
jgi:hypothetical protein